MSTDVQRSQVSNRVITVINSNIYIVCVREGRESCVYCGGGVVWLGSKGGWEGGGRKERNYPIIIITLHTAYTYNLEKR